MGFALLQGVSASGLRMFQGEWLQGLLCRQQLLRDVVARRIASAVEIHVCNTSAVLPGLFL